MFRISFPFTDSHLLLTLPLPGWSRTSQLVLLSAVLIIILGMIYRLYRNELRLISGRMALLLASLRLLLIGLLFFVTTFKPALSLTITETIPSKVMIALDRSESTRITDPQRSPREKLELARKLHLVRDLCDDTRLDRWIQQVGDRTEFAADSPELYNQVMQRVDGYTRRQIMERVLDPEGVNLLNGIAEKHRVEVMAFTQSSGDLPSAWKALQGASSSDATSTLGFTDLKQPILRALERGTTSEGKLLGLVVLSDGQHNWGQGPIARAAELGGRGVPIYPIVVGAKLPPPDVAVTSVKATPPTVFKNAYATVEARVLINNMPPGKVRVTLKYPEKLGTKPREPIVETIDHDGTSTVRTVPFQAKMDQPGTETLTVTAEAEAVPNDPRKDRFPENNSRQVVIHVAPDKAKVLIVDGEARWEFHYMHTALVRDETMETQSVVYEQPRLGAVNDEMLQRMNYPSLRLPKDTDGLMGFDCIILGDVGPEQLTMVERQKLEEYVAERGGTLVILAGKRSMPLEFMDKDDPLTKLMPIKNPRVVQRESGFPLTLTPEGKQTGFLRLDPNPGLSQERWNNLPPHYWGIVGQAKEGAVPLAFLPEGVEPKDPVAARDRERNNALFVRQNYGFGRVVFVGIDSTWRWRFKKGDEYHHRFWSQIIRWAASDRALVTGNEFVRFGAREPVYRADQEVEVLVRINDKVRKLERDAMTGARLLRKSNQPGQPDEPISLLPLKPNPVVPRELDGAQRDLPPGDYSLELVIPDLESKLNGPDGKKLRASFQVLPPDSGEMLDLSTNWNLMEDMALKSAGKMFPAERADELIELLKQRSATREFTIERKMWQSWWTLMVMLVLLSLEWFIRKAAGLP